MARLRVYQADPYQDEAARKEELKKISNAYRAVAHMTTHANVLAVKDSFRNEEEDRVVLVTEDLPGQALCLHINKPTLAPRRLTRNSRCVMCCRPWTMRTAMR